MIDNQRCRTDGVTGREAIIALVHNRFRSQCANETSYLENRAWHSMSTPSAVASSAKVEPKRFLEVRNLDY